MKFKLRNKKAMELETLGYILIGVVALAILVFASVYAKNHGLSAIEFLKNLFRLN